MEPMYSASIQIHFINTLLIFGSIAFNIALVQLATNTRDFVRRARIAMTFSTILLIAVGFTGSIMMAAKHLQFDAPNIAMIIILIALVVLEIMRYKHLRGIKIKEDGELERHRVYALKILGAEIFMSIFITVWMMMI